MVETPLIVYTPSLMMMNPDSNRQWFVYFNEKELGPFAESEVLRKIAAGDFTESAYVYTEGMSDWTLVSEIPVLQSNGPSVNPISDPRSQDFVKPQSTASGAMESDADNPFADLMGNDDVQAPSSASTQAKGSRQGNDSPLGMDEPSLSLESTDEGTEGDFASEGKTELSQPNSHDRQSDESAKKQKTTTSAKTNTAKASATKAGKTSTNFSRPLANQGGAGVKVGSEPTQKANLLTAAPSGEAVKGDPKRKRLLVLLLVLLVIGAGALFTMQDGGFQLPFMSSEEGAPPENPVTVDPPADGDSAPVENAADSTTSDPASPTAPVTANIDPPVGGGGKSALSDDEWKAFFKFRTLQDSKGPPYSLAPRPLSDKYPVVLGILSPLIKDERIFAAVYPDPERSLHAVPKIWYLEARSVDGAFSLGPLNLNGGEVPAGRYKVLIQTQSAYLHDTSFDVGVWPSEQKLKEIRSAIDNETKNLATQEREALGIKMKEMKAALMQLESKSMSAMKGKKAAKLWKEFAKPWYESLMNAFREQREITQGPMFYPDLQLKILSYMDAIRSLEESYELVSQGGAKLLARSKKKPIAFQRSQLARMDQALAADLINAEKLPILPLSVSLENVRKSLDYFVNSSGIRSANL